MAQQFSGRTHFVTIRESREVRDLLNSFGLRYMATELRRYVGNIESDLRDQGEYDAARALVQMFSRQRN